MKSISFKYIFVCLFVVMAMMFAAPVKASEKGAEKFINSLSKQVVDIVSNNKMSSDIRNKELHKIFNQNIDFNWIGNFVLGKHRRKASDSLKKRYIKAYKLFIINSYTKRFKDYAGETFKVKSTHTEAPDKYLLTTEIIRKNAANVLVDYKVKQVGNNYKIYDIVVEGVSLITTQRSEFNSVITRKGLDFLVKQLEKKAAA